MKKNILFTILFITIDIFISFSQNEVGTNKYAGIEIGSKGVKISIVSLIANANLDFAYDVLADSSVNTEIIEFNESSISESAKAAIMFYYKAINYYKIPDRQVFIVMGSGVIQQALITKNLDKIEKLKSIILNELNNPSKVIDYLTPEVEARLVHLGTIHKDDRNGSIIIDVGSGNTKGGYFDKDTNFTPFDFSWGTGKIKTEINKKQASSILEYSILVNELISKIKVNDLNTTLNQKPIIRNQPLVIMGGGISWVIATLMRPQNINKAFIELSVGDVREFKKNILTNYNNFIDDSRAKDMIALNEFTKVKRHFDQESMIAGASLVEAIMGNLDMGKPSKKFYFARYSGWLTGYLIKSKMGEEVIGQGRIGGSSKD